MQVGIGLPNTLDGADRELILSWARWADEGPFTSLGVFDRLCYHGLDPVATLAACASVTEEIELATTIIAGPLRNNAALAKKAATLDVLSNGRLTLGMALGARKDDYDAAGVEFGKRGRLFDQQLAELRDYWEGDDVGPDPVQEGGPTILVGGDSDNTYRRVGRFADGYIHGGGPPRAFARQAERANAAWTECERPETPAVWGHGYYALGDEDVAEKGREYLLDYYEFTGPFAERIADGLLTTPQEVTQFVRGYEDEGCDELVLFPTVADSEQFDLLADTLGDKWDGSDRA
ncbi:LLM class flavin-dependent oxidoreductase [Haladaptatus caseinilyticus]|uniref:LLM class flavin-dependent oxidoreductase n=1 Tax=Haladaptatus caseinilyticus TaxID=2993314 RepID=UPI00224B4A0F|nr:LLM class flavin-dependent oxidoreductase [Haladaptatus caseinilyticus]